MPTNDDAKDQAVTSVEPSADPAGEDEDSFEEFNLDDIEVIETKVFG